jgi:hypothetical protein
MVAGLAWSSRWCLVLAMLLGTAGHALAQDKVRVCVVTILASEHDTKIDKRLERIAREVQKTNPRLTGFRLGPMSSQSLAVGVKDEFKLIEDQVASITVEQAADKDNRIRIKVVPPQMGEITYSSGCGKFLPIMTPFRTKEHEQLILAVRVTPCQGK